MALTCAHHGHICYTDSQCNAAKHELCLKVNYWYKKCIVCYCEERDQCRVTWSTFLYPPWSRPTATCDCTGCPNTVQPICKPTCAYDPNPCGDNTECDDSNGCTPAFCTCLSGYTGGAYAPSGCTDINECDVCVDTHECNNGDCDNNPGSYTCNCYIGWTGELCDIDIDECISAPCQNSGTCDNTPGSYTCTCPSDTIGFQCEELLCSFAPDPCGTNAECFDMGETAEADCTCMSGYDGDPFVNCTDVDECSDMPCLNGGTCQNIPGSYVCDCEPNTAQPNCEILCSHPQAVNCASGAYCEDLGETTESYCECIPGYSSPDPETTACTDVDECAYSPSPCGQLGCTNMDPGFCCED